MSNLYEIANEYQMLLEDRYDPETGEFLPPALGRIDEVGEKLEEKVIAVASYIKNLDAEREAITQAKKNMAERESRLDRRSNYLTQYLQSNMERCGITEIKSPSFVIRLKKCPVSVDIFDEKLITDNYKRVKEEVTIDRLKLKEELQAGVVVPGAALKQNSRLEIR